MSELVIWRLMSLFPFVVLFRGFLPRKYSTVSSLALDYITLLYIANELPFCSQCIFVTTRILYKKPVYKKLEAGVKKLSVLNFLVSEKLRNLFLKQNIFPLERLVNLVNLDYFPLDNFCRKTWLFFSCIIVYFSLILPSNRPLCARNKVNSRCLIKDVRTAFRIILSAI